MTFAVNNKLRVAIVPETVFNTIPSTPTFQTLRVTKPSGGVTKQTFTSEQFDGTRYGRKNYLTGVDVGPSYDFEMSYGTFDALLAAVMRGSWSTNILKDGATAASFAIEEADTGGTSTFVRYTGCFPDEMSLSFASRKEITGSVKFFGMGQASDSSAISGATYTAATTTDVMTSGVAVGAMSVSGLTDQPIIKSIDLSIKNGLGAREELGNLYSLEPTSSPIVIEAQMMVYFQTIELYQAIMAHDVAAISFQSGLASGSKYQFDIPAGRFMNFDRQRTDLRQDQMLNLTVRAEYDPTEACTLKITRAVS